MEIMRAGKEVGRQQPFRRERRAVGAAAHRHHLRRNVQFVEGGENQIDSASIRADGVADIAVDILYRYLDGAGGVARGDLPRRIGDLLLALFKARQVEIANRGFQPRFVGVGAYFVKPDIAFAPFGMLRRLLTIETGDKIVRHQQRIDQHAFGGHRMRRHAGKTDFRRRPVEVFIHHFTQFAAVDGPGEIDVEASLQIEHLGAAQADLLIRHKGDDDIAMVAAQVLH